MSTLEQLQDATCEIKSLRNMTKRMMLTQEEMVYVNIGCFMFSQELVYDIFTFYMGHSFLCQEEVVLKRCWLARYWSLCVDHGKLIFVFPMLLENIFITLLLTIVIFPFTGIFAYKGDQLSMMIGKEKRIT